MNNREARMERAYAALTETERAEVEAYLALDPEERKPETLTEKQRAFVALYLEN